MTKSTEIGPMTAVRQFVDGFSNDDVERCQAACADEAAIIDDFPPHEWRGGSAVTSWYSDMEGMAAEYGMSDWSVLLDDPRHVMVSDQHAYVVVPIVARWSQDGAREERTGFLTASIRNGAEGWRISAFAWTWN